MAAKLDVLIDKERRVADGSDFVSEATISSHHLESCDADVFVADNDYPQENANIRFYVEEDRQLAIKIQEITNGAAEQVIIQN